MSRKRTQNIASGSVDKTRASRAGHAYHEAWAARSALELLPPQTLLKAIAVEGFSVEDTPGMSDQAIEIADIVRYYGDTNVAEASLVETVQFKYSIVNSDLAVRAADLIKTLKKFADVEVDFRKKHSAEHVINVARYVFATNRPIHAGLLNAVHAIRENLQVDGDTDKQRRQINDTLKLYDFDAGEFLSRVSLAGSQGSLHQVERALQSLLTNWGAPQDYESERRLFKLCGLIRSRVGIDGQGNNLIDRIAILAEFNIDDESKLYPTPAVFPPVENLISRPITAEIIQACSWQRPVLVHGAGGMGKTVILQAVAQALSNTFQVVLFDGFGGGDWRDPADGRYRADRTLLHLGNLLASKGLCDIILPIADELAVLTVFRERLSQAINATRQASQQGGIALILDAIDHAGISARENSVRSFAHLLLKSLAVNPIDGVIVVASCRTERRDISVGDLSCHQIHIPPFTDDEIRRLVLERDASAKEPEIAALINRSGGNPRCLDALLNAGRPYDGPLLSDSETEPGAVLDALLLKRIELATENALAKGASRGAIKLLLTGLAMLPPPVPIGELSAAYSLAEGEAESFATDLAPLLERTQYGLRFRDEPTETLIRRLSEQDPASRRNVITSLFARQNQSDYAARALPSVLTAEHDFDQLISLAFDARVPPNTSKVGQRDIRLARVLAALAATAANSRPDDLFKLLLEASLISAGHATSDKFLNDYPDLVAISDDSEARRRLFASKSAWPGRHHATLAIEALLSGDLNEARRNSQRAIDWHNWAVRQQDKHELLPSNQPSQWDDIGFAYVELLAGDYDRILNWLGKQPDEVVFKKFSKIFNLYRRHRAVTTDLSRLHDLEVVLAKTKIKSRGFWAAVVQYGVGGEEFQRVAIDRFALSSPAAKSKELPWRAITSGVSRAIQLGMRSEASTIIGFIGHKRANVFELDSSWVTDRDLEMSVILAGLSAAIRGRAPTVLDIAPPELLDIVPPSIRSKGAKAYLRELERRLAERNRTGRKRADKRRGISDDEERARYKRVLDQRIKPLLVHSNLIFKVMSAQNEGQRIARVSEALDQLGETVSKASDYPYRGGKAFLAEVAFNATFNVIDDLNSLDAATANKITTWLCQAPPMPSSILIRVVGVLSRKPIWHNAALDLAKQVSEQIDKDTGTASKISSYGSLGRAVWRVSTRESSVYFRRALDLADAIGSDDYDRTNNLLLLVSKYPGPPLSEKAAHNLGRIFELNQGESDRFDWGLYGQAMARAAGVSALGLVSRLDDRDVASLEGTFHPLLTALVQTGRIPASLAGSVLGLATPSESYVWSIATFMQEALARLDSGDREWLFNLILLEIDRKPFGSMWSDRLAHLLSLAQKYLGASSPSLLRLTQLASCRKITERSEEREPKKDWADVTNIAFTNPDEIDRAIELDGERHNGHKWPQRVLRPLVVRAETLLEQIDLLRSIVSISNATLRQKLQALEGFLDKWSARSKALLEDLPTYALALATRHADELLRPTWESDTAWEGLFGQFKGDAGAICASVVSALHPVGAEVEGDSWLALATKVTPAISISAFQDGLERFLSVAGNTLPESVGDGYWDEKLRVDNSPINALAGLIWSRLGDPHAKARWQACHSIRRIVAIGNWEIVDQIAGYFTAKKPLPFRDDRLPFYVNHARLWFLIALDRIASDRPDKLQSCRGLLEGVLGDVSFPHPVFCHYAKSALGKIAETLNACDKAPLMQILETVNISPYPVKKRKITGSLLHADRPAETSERPDQFHLEYDFNKYQVEEVSRIFGVPGWMIDDRITEWVRRWDGEITSMYTCPRLSRDDYRLGGESTGRAPEVDRYGGYLGWHALMLVAGEMLQALPVQQSEWREDGDEWASFIRGFSLSRDDGFWLSDATDLFPPTVASSIDMPRSDPPNYDGTDAEILLPLLGIIRAREIEQKVVVGGHWNLGGHLTISTGTLLVPPDRVETVLASAITESPFFRYLPSKQDDVERDFEVAGGTIAAWLSSNEVSDLRLDRNDPYGATHANSRSAPEEWLAIQEELTSSDPFGRHWNNPTGSVFKTIAWGAKGGRGERSWEEGGDLIEVDGEFLKALLAKEGKVLAGYIKAQKYVSSKSERVAINSENDGAFVHRSAFFFIDPKGQVVVAGKLTSRQDSAIKGLPKYDRGDFSTRFKVLTKLASKA